MRASGQARCGRGAGAWRDGGACAWDTGGSGAGADPCGGGDGPRIGIDVAPDANIEIPVVEDRLAQVFRNLIGNAVSFSPPGGAIDIQITRENGVIAIAIGDDGPGIPDGKLEAVFDRFYTERPAGEKFGTHSGLGLSISKQIVEAHGGTIEAEAEGIHARVVQHECDHLDGILYPERMEDLSTLMFESEWNRARAAADEDDDEKQAEETSPGGEPA